MYLACCFIFFLLFFFLFHMHICFFLWRCIILSFIFFVLFNINKIFIIILLCMCVHFFSWGAILLLSLTSMTSRMISFFHSLFISQRLGFTGRCWEIGNFQQLDQFLDLSWFGLEKEFFFRKLMLLQEGLFVHVYGLDDACTC